MIDSGRFDDSNTQMRGKINPLQYPISYSLARLPHSSIVHTLKHILLTRARPSVYALIRSGHVHKIQPRAAAKARPASAGMSMSDRLFLQTSHRQGASFASGQSKRCSRRQGLRARKGGGGWTS